ncbi:transposase InsK for insertion sequence [Streptococcus pneumoniae]|nr:transposase InsK for insertion sequence [Streptococcus pneumoniae]
MNYTPKVRQKKSNFWGVFIMKLSYDSNLRYMIKLIDRYGIEFVKKGKNRYYSPDLKQEMIHKV